MSWEQLLSIYRQNAEELHRAETEQPLECPNCGSPLDEARGLLNCPMGDWQGPVGRPA
ncbi:hypothetical protein [Lentzea aerocolonigenes]|uniref:hypothetical protein n=1 Tax=Lentzea aerocolonigenes TaxID=68170 RepID=UPI000A9B64C2|nr:hypothetical protein [Lentzea aerocolonigenes]MCP2248741.1 hypothetical protein [Lentzea aerocolonigenes]